MATRVFEWIKFFQEILKRIIAGTFLWNFIKILWVVSEKNMFKEKVNAQTDRHTDVQWTTGHDISLLAYGQWSLKVEQFLW